MSTDGEKNIIVDRGQPPSGGPGSSTGKGPAGGGWNLGPIFLPGGGSTGGFGGSASKRARKRAKARAAALAAQAAARAQAEAATAHAQAVEAAKHAAHQAEVQRRAEQERVHAAHQLAIEALTGEYQAVRNEALTRHETQLQALPAMLEQRLKAEVTDIDGASARENILRRKTRINYLIGEKSREANRHAIAGQAYPMAMETEEYRALLLERSSTPEEAHHQHQAWSSAHQSTLTGKLLSREVEWLTKRSAVLSEQYARHVVDEQERSRAAIPTEQFEAAQTFWTMVAGTASGPSESPNGWDKVKSVAGRAFVQAALRSIGTNLPALVAFYSPTLGDGELGPSWFAIPARELGISETIDLEFIAAQRGSVPVTHRLSTKWDEDNYWLTADGKTVSNKVPVRTFTYNIEKNLHEFIRDEDDAPSLVWTPAVRPENNSTSLPSSETYNGLYVGTTVPNEQFFVDGFPAFDLDTLEDYILVFPADSGLPPLYIAFKSPRYLPGTVTGQGGQLRQDWEAHASTQLGAEIPQEIAEELRGRTFSQFRYFRNAIWRRMSKLEKVKERMPTSNLELMKEVYSPKVSLSESYGSRARYELHHVIPISKGGGVYDIDNIVILTPHQHVSIHRQ